MTLLKPDVLQQLQTSAVVLFFKLSRFYRSARVSVFVLTGRPRPLPDVLVPSQLTVRLSAVILDDFVYVATISGQKVFVVKRQNQQHQPVNV